MENIKIPLLRDVIKTTVSNVWFCDHQPDNSFLHFNLEKTEVEMYRRGYIPEGICLNPEYKEEMGVGLSL